MLIVNKLLGSSLTYFDIRSIIMYKVVVDYDKTSVASIWEKKYFTPFKGQSYQLYTVLYGNGSPKTCECSPLFFRLQELPVGRFQGFWRVRPEISTARLYISESPTCVRSSYSSPLWMTYPLSQHSLVVTHCRTCTQLLCWWYFRVV